MASRKQGGDETPQADLVGDDADMEEAWLAFALMESTEWRFLPYAGGLLDQPEALMRNIMRIASIVKSQEGGSG